MEMKLLIGSPLHEAEALTEILRTKVTDLRQLLHPRRSSWNPFRRLYQRLRYGKEKQVSMAAILLPYVGDLPAPKLRADPGSGIREVADRAESQVLSASALVDLRRTTEPDIVRAGWDDIADVRRLHAAERRLREAEGNHAHAELLSDQAAELDQLASTINRAADVNLMRF